MNVHPDSVLNTILPNKLEATPFILASVSFDLEASNLQMEYIKNIIQETTLDYLISSPIPENSQYCWRQNQVHQDIYPASPLLYWI